MERRDFLKYMIGMSACMGCACSNISIGNSKQKKKKSLRKDDGKTWLMDHIGIPICYHCNLNCAYCNHYCPLVEKEESISVEQFERDVKKLSELTNKSLREFVLIGGEPLLHKDIEQLIKIASHYFPDSYKRIITNGILLKTMPESFWNICRENEIKIKVTTYPNIKQCPTLKEIKQFKKDKNVNISARKLTKGRFYKTNFTKTPKPANQNKCQDCMLHVQCAQLDNGILYPCCVMSNIRFFNNYFKDYEIPLVESDYLNIHKISSFEEMQKYFARNKEFCRYCNYAEESAPWKLSNKELSEWYDIISES